MTTKSKVIIIVISAAVLVGGAFTGGYFTGRRVLDVTGTIMMVPEGPAETTFIKPPVTECEKSPIAISGVYKDGYFKVAAYDMCKTTTQNFKVVVPERKNIFIFQPVVGWNIECNRLEYGADVSYFRKLNQTFGVGGGLTVTNMSAKVHIGLLVHLI